MGANGKGCDLREKAKGEGNGNINSIPKKLHSERASKNTTTCSDSNKK